MKNLNYASVIIFSYNRPKLLSSLLSSLKKNKETKFTQVYFFQDSYIGNEDKDDVKKCLNIIKKVNFFKKKRFL